MTDQNSDPTGNAPAFPETAYDIPVEMIREPQDCIDFGTVRFILDTVIDQGAKRAVVGECVVTDRKFEAVYLHENVLLKDRDIPNDEPLHRFYLDRVWQYQPSKFDVEPRGLYRQLREQSRAFGTEDTHVGPTKTGQAPECERLDERFNELFKDR